jgi:chromosomal replication initiation ATPase DnaA
MTKEIILKTVCNILDVEIRDVLQGRHVKGAGKAEFVMARNLFIYFAFKRYLLGSQSAISNYVNRDHATLINALKTVSNDNETSPARLTMFLKVEQRLKSIEIDIAREGELSEVGFDYQDLTVESLSYQTNK